MGEEEAAGRLEYAVETEGQTFKLGERKLRWPFQDKPWQYTAHTFGYLAAAAPGSDAQPIRHIENISADPGLRGARIRLTLNRLRIAAYPGGGVEAFAGPIGLRVEVGDEIYMNNGANNNLRVTFSPSIRF